MGTNLPKALPFAQMKDIYLPQDAVIAHKKPFDQVQSRVYDSSNGSGQDLRLGATKRKNRATILQSLNMSDPHQILLNEDVTPSKTFDKKSPDNSNNDLDNTTNALQNSKMTTTTSMNMKKMKQIKVSRTVVRQKNANRYASPGREEDRSGYDHHKGG